MVNIQITWLKSSNLKPDDIAMYFVSGFVSSEMTDIEGDDRWVLKYEVLNAGIALMVSKMAIEMIKRNAHPMSGCGQTDPMRAFVTDEEGNEAATEDLNTLLRALDYTKHQLRRAEQNCQLLKDGITVAARQIKATRSDKMSTMVGGKLSQIRQELEKLPATI